MKLANHCRIFISKYAEYSKILYDSLKGKSKRSNGTVEHAKYSQKIFIKPNKRNSEYNKKFRSVVKIALSLRRNAIFTSDHNH